MRNLSIVLCGIVFWTCSGKSEKMPADVFVPEEYAKKYDIQQRINIYNVEYWAKQHSFFLVMSSDTSKYHSLIPLNMNIRDVFTNEEIDNAYDKDDPADRKKFGIYLLYGSTGKQLMLLYNNGSFDIFVPDDYPKVLNDLVEYFDKHKNLDRRLLPLCVQEVNKMYVSNRRSFDDHGPWRHWWGDEADSLGKIYNQYLNF